MKAPRLSNVFFFLAALVFVVFIGGAVWLDITVKKSLYGINSLDDRVTALERGEPAEHGEPARSPASE